MPSAPYRFIQHAELNQIIPSASQVIPAEYTAKGAINRPKAIGLCAEIELMWEAETPLLIGSQRDRNDRESAESPAAIVTPLHLGQSSNDYYIPGSTLRGAIRSIAEIAAGACLSQVNAGRVFPLRDFDHSAYRQNQQTRPGPAGRLLFPVSDATQVKAGWLSLKDTNRCENLSPNKNKTKDISINESFKIEPCEWYAINVSDMNVGEVLRFVQKSTLSKYTSVECAEGARAKPMKTARRYVKQQTNFNTKYCMPDTQNRKDAFDGFYVFSGRAPNPPKNTPDRYKKIEYVFTPPLADESFDVPALKMQQFREINSTAVDDELRLDDNTWKLAILAFIADKNTRWPVFYVGEPGSPSFFFGLTRLFKVPHAWSFAHALAASGATKPLRAANAPHAGSVNTDILDMVDTLFGYVHEPPPGPENSSRSPAENARKGRIAFSSARLMWDSPSASPEIFTQETILAAPRPSFAPFYLRADQDGFRDYSSPHRPKIAGRKRYLPQVPPGNTDRALERVRANLSQQLRNNPDAGPDIKSSLTFLKPTVGAPLKFTSTIRLFNVTRAELGMVLWSLTFGGNDQCRHMLGRAKPFGAGQVKLTIEKLRVHTNDSFEEEKSPDPKVFMEEFDEYIGYSPETKTGHLKAAREALIKLSDPAHGDALHRAGALNTMLLPDFRNVRSDYKPRTDNRRPSSRNPLP